MPMFRCTVLSTLVALLASPTLARETATKAPKAPAAAPCPTPFDTNPCTCTTKEYRLVSTPLGFFEHVTAAAAQGCQIATLGDTAERDLVVGLLQANPPPGASNNPALEIAWVGLGGPTTFSWLDNCVPFDTSFFAGGEPNGGAAEPVGGIVYQDLFSGTLPAPGIVDIGIGDAGGPFSLPAVYECCVAPPTPPATVATKAPKSTKSPTRRRLRF